MKNERNIDFWVDTTSSRIRQRRAKKTLLYPLFQRGLGGFSSNFHILDRGYTGHEHLLDHGIINMNGRIYDPIVGQFMQADNYIQTPEDYIGYNRYAYCRYNPFKFTDPSGEMWRASGFKEQGMNPAASYMYNDDVECPAPVPSPNAYEKEITYTGWKNGKFTTWTVSASGSGGGRAPSVGAAGGKSNDATGETGTSSSQEQETGTDGTGKVEGPAEEGKLAPWQIQELKDEQARDSEFDGSEKKQIRKGTPYNLDDCDAYENFFAFNCHSYAWHNGKGDPSDSHNSPCMPKWDNYPLDDAEELARPLQGSEDVGIGDRVIYFDENGNPLHSAIVSEVNEYGLASRVTSKWGSAPLYEHHPRDVDPSYGNYRKYYRMNNGGR